MAEEGQAAIDVVHHAQMRQAIDGRMGGGDDGDALEQRGPHPLARPRRIRRGLRIEAEERLGLRHGGQHAWIVG